ncbi:MADS-box AGL71-like isoform X1 [Olea europaea subsp. europaea]|uniref:MADS-box AGL71-like isoform X1 n=1 Tax=Olea europaea subsp. europaea TaxID=158383 RepID=A0A8S0T6N1_OLEEU|nr:MADS-box AGL71-like isoform X1 [Olea europaea subsp. europaea]
MYTTFTKRRQGLFKKAKALCTMCDESVLNRYFTYSSSSLTKDEDEVVVPPILLRLRETKMREEDCGVDGAGKGIMGCWCSELVLLEIDELEVAIQEIKHKVVARSGEIISNGEDQD